MDGQTGVCERDALGLQAAAEFGDDQGASVRNRWSLRHRRSLIVLGIMRRSFHLWALATRVHRR